MEPEKELIEEKARKVADILQNDPYAPHYHFIAPGGKARPFDPNGAIYWNNRYHLFYIFQDPALPYGGHCWGHVSSGDLLHWTFHPTALLATDSDPEAGIFSGCAFVNPEGVPTLMYYGIDAGICIATPEDNDLIEWRKSPHNPVIPVPRKGDPGWGVYRVFDPHTWVEGDTVYAICGGKVKPYDLYDTAYLFRSKDLVNWEYLRPFYNPNPHWTGGDEDCACPDFFKIGNRYALVCISHSRGARYYLGRYQEGTFIPEEHHRMNWPGGSCFAPESLLDDRGRHIFWAWVIDQRKGKGIVTDELGVMTMPRVLSLDEDGQLLIDPPEEFETLRYNHRRRENLTVGGSQEIVLDGIAGDVMELALEAKVPSYSKFGVKVRMTPNGEEATSILIDTAKHTLSIDTTQSSLSSDVFQRYPIAIGGVEQLDIRVQTAPFELKQNEPLKLRIFIDKSILEVYANRRQCVTQRIYPTRPDSLNIAIFTRRGTVKVKGVDAWDIKTINGQSS